jgi:hypothetical protein
VFDSAIAQTQLLRQAMHKFYLCYRLIGCVQIGEERVMAAKHSSYCFLSVVLLRVHYTVSVNFVTCAPQLYVTLSFSILFTSITIRFLLVKARGM